MFSYVCCKYFYLDVCNGYTRGFKFFLVFYKCFRRMLQVFQLFRTYVANVFSRCCKSRSSVAHVAMWPIYNSRLLQLLGPPACAWVWRGCEQETVQAQIETGRHGTRSERGTHYGHGTRCSAGPHVKQAQACGVGIRTCPCPDIRVLAFPYLLRCTTHVHVVITNALFACLINRTFSPNE